MVSIKCRDVTHWHFILTISHHINISNLDIQHESYIFPYSFGIFNDFKWFSKFPTDNMLICVLANTEKSPLELFSTQTNYDIGSANFSTTAWPQQQKSIERTTNTK